MRERKTTILGLPASARRREVTHVCRRRKGSADDRRGQRVREVQPHVCGVRVQVHRDDRRLAAFGAHVVRRERNDRRPFGRPLVFGEHQSYGFKNDIFVVLLCGRGSERSVLRFGRAGRVVIGQFARERVDRTTQKPPLRSRRIRLDRFPNDQFDRTFRDFELSVTGRRHRRHRGRKPKSNGPVDRKNTTLDRRIRRVLGKYWFVDGQFSHLQH